MSSDGEDEIPACVFRSHAGRQPAARHPHRPEAHDLSDDDEEGGGDVNMSKVGGSASTMRESMMRRAEASEVVRDGRGHHVNRGVQRGYAQQAFEHKQAVENWSLGKPCKTTCQFGQRCGLNITPAILLRAHYHAFGTSTEKVSGADGEPDTYTCRRPFAEVQQQRKSLVLNSISWSAADPTLRVERFMVEDVGPVCSEYCRVAYGVPHGTWIQLLADGRAGRLRADQEWAEATDDTNESVLRDGGNVEKVAAKEETIEWWVLWFTLEDQMPNEPVCQQLWTPTLTLTPPTHHTPHVLLCGGASRPSPMLAIPPLITRRTHSSPGAPPI